MEQAGKKRAKKGKPTYITSILMVALMLFLLGLAGMIVLQFRALSKTVKEQIKISLYLRDNVKQADVLLIQKRLEAEPFVKSSEYVSKEEAKKRFLMNSDAEDDFEDLIGYNPLPAHIDFFLHAEYANADSIAQIKIKVRENFASYYRDLGVNEALVGSLDKNIRLLGFVLLGVCVLLLIISVLMIDSTVRLAMYSNRFLIKNMQMIGATRAFIVKPYLARAVINGMISAMLAILGLIAFMSLAYRQVPELKRLQNLRDWGVLFASLVVIGIVINVFSTRRAVSKYLKMKLEDLY